MNPRVSRSSALASKATGFPIAKSRRDGRGMSLDEIPNDITKKTPACFERHRLRRGEDSQVAVRKISGADSALGTQMNRSAKSWRSGGPSGGAAEGIRSLEPSTPWRARRKAGFAAA